MICKLLRMCKIGGVCYIYNIYNVQTAFHSFVSHQVELFNHET